MLSVRQDMPGKARLISEPHRTHMAVKRFLARMGAEVLDQVTTLHEVLAAQVALIWSLASVCPLVVLHVGVVHRGVAAERAPKQMPPFPMHGLFFDRWAMSATCRG